MGKYIVKGGNRLTGELSIGGAKNSVLPIIAASILNKKTSTIHNCPKISDTYHSIEILKHLGCKVVFEDNTLFIDSSNLSTNAIPEAYVAPMRSSIIFLGSLLGREGECILGYPGGCELGKRPIDLHLFGLRALGATIIEDDYLLKATVSKLIGTEINLKFPSVGATENIMLASVLAKGTTIINNAAREPEIVDLQNFLTGMGANINGAGTSKITISGVKELQSVEYTINPDRIVAGTYIIGTIMTGGEVLLTNITSDTISTYTKTLISTGATLKDCGTKGLYITAPKEIKAIDYIETQPHPGFPTDMQSQFVAMLSLAKGQSTVVENIFEARTKHIEELNKMGANILISKDQKTFKIQGVESLVGTLVTAKDLRGGASLILAGLVAQGFTVVDNAHFIQRGYENIEQDIKQLGGKIKLIQDKYQSSKTA